MAGGVEEPTFTLGTGKFLGFLCRLITQYSLIWSHLFMTPSSREAEGQQQQEAVKYSLAGWR